MAKKTTKINQWVILVTECVRCKGTGKKPGSWSDFPDCDLCTGKGETHDKVPVQEFVRHLGLTWNSMVP